VDSAESFPASAQIGNYIAAPVAQLEIVPTAPSIVMVRSRGTTNGLGVFFYLDTPEGRKQDAWSKWEFGSLNGYLLGVKHTPAGVLLFWLRLGAGSTWRIVADLLPMSADLSALPYLDSMRPIAVVNAATSDITNAAPAPWSLAFDNTTDRFLIGTTLPDRASLSTEYPTEYSSAWVGVPFDSYLIPTNPFHKDAAGKAVLSGRFVITKHSVAFKDSSGCIVSITSGEATEDYAFNARVLGDILNTIGKVPISSTIHSIPVGRETREYSMTIKSRKWFPFTLVNMEWTGQSYNRTPRASTQ
jgi:hypothetical protein